MTRRLFFFAAGLLQAAFLLSTESAALQVPRPNEEPLPPTHKEVWRLPDPPHEIELPLPRGAEHRPQSLTKEEKLLLSVPSEDREAHAGFLKGSRTGLVRLLPRETFDGKLKLRGGGAYYSFARRVHEYGYGSDIELQRGRLSVGFAGADFGFLHDLGDTPLETISTETDGVRFMSEFKPPAAEQEARMTALQFSRVGTRRSGRVWLRDEGLQLDGRTYSRSLPAIVGHTYALRSINYERSDLLIAFRVLRRDDNGSLVLLWKILKKYPAPALHRNTAARH